MSSAEQIHFYDVEPSVPDKGWVHYTSRVPGWEGVDARVADVVRSLEDVSAHTVGFIPNQVPTSMPSGQTRLLLAEEAVRISLAAPTWLDRIMTRSPLRDHQLWRRSEKARYLGQRRQRRKKFKEGTLVLAEPNIPEEESKLPEVGPQVEDERGYHVSDDGQHRTDLLRQLTRRWLGGQQ